MISAEPKSSDVLICADAGRLNEARQTLRGLVDKRPSRVPEEADYLVIGRMAEHYGLDEFALDAYARIAKPVGDAANTSWQIAQRRRSVIGKTASRK